MFHSIKTTLTRLWEELNDITFKALKESLMNPAAFEHPNDQIHFPLFLLALWKREEVSLGYSSRKMETPCSHSVESSMAGPSGAKWKELMPQRLLRPGFHQLRATENYCGGLSCGAVCSSCRRVSTVSSHQHFSASHLYTLKSSRSSSHVIPGHLMPLTWLLFSPAPTN